MERVRAKYRLMPILLASFMLLIGTFYYGCANAKNNVSPAPGTQLAYFIGYHSYNGGYYRPGYIYYGPRHYPRRSYWTGWRSIGYGCRQTCLIDRWSGRAIRCSRRCL